MNARQKAKHYKKKLEKLWDEYVNAVYAAQEAYDNAQDMVEDILLQQTTCMVTKCFDGPVEVDETIANEMITRLEDLYDHYKQAVVFEGHTDPETGKYILEAKLTVVMPDFSEDEEVLDE